MKTPDFSKMIFDIAAKTKMKDCQIAARLGEPPSSIAGWKNSGREPRYTAGAKLIEFHKRACGA